MDERISGAISNYLIGSIEFDSLEDHLVPLAWDSDIKSPKTLDDVLFALIHFKDGLFDEPTLRSKLEAILLSGDPVIEISPVPSASSRSGNNASHRNAVVSL